MTPAEQNVLNLARRYRDARIRWLKNELSTNEARQEMQDIIEELKAACLAIGEPEREEK